MTGKISDPGNCTISFGTALRFWFKLGFVSFGGPAGQIAIMHQELVERRRWISERRFLHALNYCMVLPGPEAQQLATYIGWLMHKTRGGIAAGLLFVLPSLFALIALSWIYMAFGHLPVIAGLFYGIKPAVTAIVLQAAWRIGTRVLNNALLWSIAALAFIAIFAFDTPFPLIVIGAALLGWASQRWFPQHFRVAPHRDAGIDRLPALIDDDTPIPPHARYTRRRLLGIAGAGMVLWILPIATLCAAYGWTGTLPQVGWFFTKAALMTFGGAYAVLPYVYQGAVDHYQWLTPVQMIDGLALGETTPGPLIMVVAFVGFVAGWTQAIPGIDSLLLAGAAAAVVATWFTFLPSFIFILAGGPLVESTHDHVQLTAPLTAITAAVVGVIVNLAAFFAYHVWWPQGFGAAIEWPAVLITTAAAIALLRFKRHVIEVIALCGVLGLIVQSAG